MRLNKRNAVVFSSLVLVLFFSISVSVLQISFEEESSTPIILKPNKDGVYFSDWGVYGTTSNKASAVTDNADNTGVARTSNGKSEGFGIPSAEVASDAKISRVVIEVTAKNTGATSNALNLTWLKGKTGKDISLGPNNSVSSTGYVKVLRSESINPFTKVAWTASDVNNWKFGANQIAVGLNMQTKQNTEKINVSEVRILVYLEKDITAPNISLLINNDPQTPLSVSNIWYNQNVNVKWVVTDPESGILSSSGCEEQNIVADTSGITFSCSATNGDGLTSAPVYVIIKRDTIKPDIALDDSADNSVDDIITVQADQTIGKNVDYMTTASDDRSGVSTGPTCTPFSGTLFGIADTPINCTTTDNAGNSITEIFSIRVLPFIFIALGDTDHPIYQNDLTDVIVADPAANATSDTDTVTVLLSSDGPPEFGTANAILTETSPGIFEGSVIFSEADSEDSVAPLPANLYAGLGTLVQATYVAADARGTSITPFQSVINKTPPGEGGAAYIALLPALSWNSDAAHIDTAKGITAKRNAGQAGCTSASTVETISVTVKSASDAVGFTRTLTETSASSCVLSTSVNVKFTTASSDTNIPQIKTDVGQTVTVTDSLANTGSILILPVPKSAPVSGIALPTTSVDCGVGGDSDSDGICNSWEDGSNPLTIGDFGFYVYSNDGFSCPRLIDDPNGNTVANPILVDNILNPATCPDPNKKDIFYEIDYMPNHRPNYLALSDVITAFKNAPAQSTSCPTCPGPITLHFKINEEISIHDDFIPWSTAPSASNPLGGFDQIKQLYYGSPADRTDSSVLLSERQVMRYILNTHQQEEIANQKSSGYSEIYGNDIEISMGPFSGGTGTRMEQAGTYMHEIGHGIGLNHGGGATNTQNCKPNHLSVMGYAMQFTNYVPSRPLDFSRVQLADLNENSLTESKGISSPGAVLTTVYGPSTGTGGILSKTLSASGNTPISWNRDTDTVDTGVSQDINYFGFPGCMADDGYAAKTTLTGSNDWSKINLLFRTTTATFADGIQALNPINPSQNIGSYEPTSDIFQTGSGQPPVIDDGGPYNVNEGDIVTLDGSASADPDGVVEIYRWNFGDEQWDTPGVDVLGPQAIIFADDDANSPFTANLGIWDDSANGISKSVDVNVTNVNPVVTSSGVFATINEGDALIIDNTSAFSFTDPGILDTHTASIDWGDSSSSIGTVSETLGIAPILDPFTARVDTSGIVTGTHVYVDDKVYSTTVTITDKDGGIGTFTKDITVLNVAPEIIDIGSSGGSFIDPGADSWTGTIDYGDGSNDVLTIDNTAKTFAIPEHVYACGSYTTIVTITDDEGASGTANYLAQIYCNVSFDSPLPGSNYEINRTIPTKINIINADGTPVTNAVVTMYILQDGTQQAAITSEGTNVINGSTTGSYQLHIKLSGYSIPIHVGPAHIIAVLDTGQIVDSEEITIK
jgi:hypothetical protein